MTKEEREALMKSIQEAIGVKTKESDAIVAQIQVKLDAGEKVSEGLKSALAEATSENQKLHGRLADLEQKFAEGQKAPAVKGDRSPGQMFVESDQLKDFVKRGGKGNSDVMELRGADPFRLRAVTSLGGSAGPGIWSDRLPGVVEEPLRQLTIRSLLDVGTTSSNLIEWIKELVFTNEADVVSEGAQKPESNITYAREDVPVRTIAHWIHATRQVLADFPQLMTLINGRMRYGLAIAEENQILLGDGTGNNILGLIPQATAYNNALNRANDTMIDVIRHAILQVRLSFYPATGIVMTPTDWHNIELTKDNENRYLMANPQGNLPPMLWGRPVVESDAMPNDQFLVGAFRLAATLFDREQATIAISTEDRDNFIKNMVTILVEERLALAVSRPRAFVHGGFPAGSTT